MSIRGRSGRNSRTPARGSQGKQGAQGKRGAQGNRGRRGARGAQTHSAGAQQSKREKQDAARRAPEEELQQQRRAEEELGPFPFGFVRGTTPEKWVKRWRERHPARPLTAEALGEFPLESLPGQSILADGGVLLVRATHGTIPAFAGDNELHAVKLYEEKVGLIAAKDTDFAELDELTDLSLLGLSMLLDYEGYDASWPQPTAWVDPAYRPHSAAGAAELIATGMGVTLAPLTLARHVTQRRAHTVVPINVSSDELPGTSVWAVWRRDRDSAQTQELAGILRGRTARSSR